MLFINALFARLMSGSLWEMSIHNYSYDLLYNGHPTITNICPEYTLSAHGTTVSVCSETLYNPPTLYHDIHDPLTMDEYALQRIVYVPIHSNIPIVSCNFKLLNNSSQTLLYTMEFSEPVYTNRISLITHATLTLNFSKTRVLRVPFDNDLQSIYSSLDLNYLTKITSCYVSAIYNNSQHSNTGLILGFLNHSVWKTGIEFERSTINAVAGINGVWLTRDTLPHGSVVSNKSPILFIHMNADWRYGMEAYADMIDTYVPFKTDTSISTFSGWNSWSMAVNKKSPPGINILERAIDTVADLKTNGFGPHQYIVHDAVYFLNDTDTNKWVHYAHNKSEKTGSYSMPFVFYIPDDPTQSHISCSRRRCDKKHPQCYLIKDLLLKDTTGNPIELSESQRILDITHPGSQCIVHRDINISRLHNMDLVKYDFLNHLCREGIRYNMTLAPTGMAAYTYGVQFISKILNNTIFMDYGISPPFPIIKGKKSRRQGCDQMFGGIVYSMNQYAGGWWLNKFYILDPDLVSLEETYWFKPVLKNLTKEFSMDSRGRVAKAIVYGGAFKNGDDLTNATMVGLVKEAFGNRRVNAMWKRNIIGDFSTSFRPVSWEKEKTLLPIMNNIIPPSTYIRINGDIVVFNFGLLPRIYTVDLSKTNINQLHVCTDIWNNKRRGILLNNSVILEVKPLTAALIECR